VIKELLILFKLFTIDWESKIIEMTEKYEKYEILVNKYEEYETITKL
jgi:hypothetical protein